MMETDIETVKSNSITGENTTKDVYPTPTDLTISTCTVVSNINDDFNLDLFSRIVPVYNTNDPVLETKEGGIHNITLYTDYSRGTFSEDKKKKIKEFNNQVTIEYKYWGFRTINIKIFTNGKLQMTGIKNSSEAEMITNKIINYIKTLPIKIYTNENSVDDTFGINWIYNYQKKKIDYVRKNNDTIKSIIKITCSNYEDKHLFTHAELRNLLSKANKHLTAIQDLNRSLISLLKNINDILFNEKENTNKGKQKYKSFNYSHSTKKHTNINTTNNSNNNSNLQNYEDIDNTNTNIININILQKVLNNLTEINRLHSIQEGIVNNQNQNQNQNTNTQINSNSIEEIDCKKNYIITSLSDTDALNKLNIVFNNLKFQISDLLKDEVGVIKNTIELNISSLLSFIINYINYHLKTINLNYNSNIDFKTKDNFKGIYEYITEEIEKYHTSIYKKGTKISKVRLQDEETCDLLNKYVLKDINKDVEKLFLEKDFDEKINKKQWSFKIEDLYHVKKNFKICEVKTELINSDYNVRFYIDLKILASILKTKYGIFNSYDPDGYPGVLAKYYYNLNNKVQGLCNCPVHCSTKEKKSSCCKITISIFRPGSIIITGAKSIEQLKCTYDFINKTLRENYKAILGKCDEEEHKNGLINNDIRKISRKPRLFYIKKSNIQYQM